LGQEIQVKSGPVLEGKIPVVVPFPEIHRFEIEFAESTVLDTVPGFVLDVEVSQGFVGAIVAIAALEPMQDPFGPAPGTGCPTFPLPDEIQEGRKGTADGAVTLEPIPRDRKAGNKVRFHGLDGRSQATTRQEEHGRQFRFLHVHPHLPGLVLVLQEASPNRGFLGGRLLKGAAQDLPAFPKLRICRWNVFPDSPKNPVGGIEIHGKLPAVEQGKPVFPPGLDPLGGQLLGGEIQGLLGVNLQFKEGFQEGKKLLVAGL